MCNIKAKLILSFLQKQVDPALSVIRRGSNYSAALRKRQDKEQLERHLVEVETGR